MDRSLVTRALGLLTLGYGAFTAARPSSLVHAAELEPRGRPLSTQGRALGTVVGVRDVLSGMSLVLAPAGAPLRWAVAVRSAIDLGDAVAFGWAAPRQAKAKVVLVAVGWGVLCAGSIRFAGKP